LNINKGDPIIGTIVKPKTGLTLELFSRSVVESALAGAKFTKADENMHLTLKEVPKFVSRTVKDLEKAGVKRFLFAPHITANPAHMMDYAKAAIDSGATALMFSPYYCGGFQVLGEIVDKFDVPVYSHTAGMNMLTGASNWGFASSIMYRFAAWYGAAFMQLTTVAGYLRPFDSEKPDILNSLGTEKLIGDNGMTLAIAGGLGASNIGANMKVFGTEGLMFLAGTSVYSHPDGASSGVKAIILAHKAYREQGIIKTNELIEFGKSLDAEGVPLVNALAK
jgi:ribulose-bisphosphate carboxylase large chain